MSKIKDIIVASVLPAIKAVGKIEMETVLLDIKMHNSEALYKTTLQGLYSNFTLLKNAALKTRTKIDDGIIDLVLEAVEEMAENEDIVLSTN